MICPCCDLDLVDALAALEHDQWMEWASAMMLMENISPERKARWEKLMIPYVELPEKMKEQDRIYARKVIQVLKDKGVIT